MKLDKRNENFIRFLADMHGKSIDEIVFAGCYLFNCYYDKIPPINGEDEFQNVNTEITTALEKFQHGENNGSTKITNS